MRIPVALAGCLVSVCLFAPAARAAEPVLEFLEGLRGRGYFDMALLYLDQVEANPDLPSDVRNVLLYERAQTLLGGAATLTSLDAQRRQLDAAEAAFDAFITAQPKHALVGEAHTARGSILLEKARVDIWTSERPAHKANREAMLKSAREEIQKARRIFDQAREQHKKAYDAFPSSIPEQDKKQIAARDQAEANYIHAQHNLAQCLYWEAQTFPKGSAERKQKLTQAATGFQKIHEQYRSMVGGLLAQLWQGKCFEEQGEIGIALGFYGELLDHPSSGDWMRDLQDLTLQFRLICLNHEKKKDHQLVIQEAEEWLRANRNRSRTEAGLGIQWESCIAYEAIGNDRTQPENVRKNALTQALARARAINLSRASGPYRAGSSAMIQRLMAALNREPGDPKDFDTAQGIGSQLFDEVTRINAALARAQAAGQKKERETQQAALIATAGEMARVYELALRLATPASDETMVNHARLRLAYAYLLNQKYYDAAVVAEFQLDRHSDKFPDIGADAGFIALTAWHQAFQQADEPQRDFEAQRIAAVAEALIRRWPDSERAQDARDTAGRAALATGDLLKAAEWWRQIPSDSPQYANAQVRAGKTYWRQYVLQAARPADERPAPEQLSEWKSAATHHLEAGLAAAEKTIPASSPLPDDLVGAKISLANIRNLDGLYKQAKNGPAGALELLTKGPHSVIRAVDVPEGQKRPADPSKAQSRQLASAAYQQLLRTHIGLQNLDEARDARLKLEQVAGSEDAAALTQVFVEFGRELERELERLQASGETSRLNDVRDGFESFLSDLLARQDGQTFYSLLWIAETYTSLAEGSRDQPARAAEFSGKAANAYQAILDKAAADAEFARPEQTLACRLRLVNALRRQRQFPRAEEIIFEVLRASPNAPDAQFEAARLYQDWAASAQDAWDKYPIALYGKKEPVNVWGWNQTAQSLQRAAGGRADDRLKQLAFDARFQLAQAERDLGRAHPEKTRGEEHLQRARSSIVGFQRLSKRWPDEEYLRFNDLYRSILSDLGRPVSDLPRELADSGGGEIAVDPPQPAVAAPAETLAASKETELQATGAQFNVALMTAVVLLGAGAVTGLFFLSGRKRKGRYASSAPARGAAARPGRALPETLNFGSSGGSPAKATAKPTAVNAVAAKTASKPSAAPRSRSAAKPPSGTSGTEPPAAPQRRPAAQPPRPASAPPPPPGAPRPRPPQPPPGS